ncbi:hypothetical protein JW859_08805 [bacterium]|nr:hypothetical protein [bacterium]
MQNLLNFVMRRAGTDAKGRPLAPRVAVLFTDDAQIDVLLDSAGPSALQCRRDDGQEMIIPYTAIKYIMP